MVTTKQLIDWLKQQGYTYKRGKSYINIKPGARLESRRRAYVSNGKFFVDYKYKHYWFVDRYPVELERLEIIRGQLFVLKPFERANVRRSERLNFD